MTRYSRKDLLALAVLSLFGLYLFREIVFSGHLLVGDDFVTFYLGMKKFLFDEVRLHGEIPYWNPYIFGGMPFWAHFESTIFYPLGFLFYLVPPEQAYGYTMFFHLLLAGFFMYLLARSLGLAEFGSFVAAAVFLCNGFVMAILFLGHMSPVESYIWLPLVIYFVHRASGSPKPWANAMAAGGLWGVQILAGAPQDAFYTFLAATLFLLCTIRGRGEIRRSAVRAAAVAATVFVVGAGLSSVQILPALELISESVRASLDTYEWATLASFPLEGLITILLPHFFGNYADGTLWIGNVPWSLPHQNLYVGLLPVVLLGFVSFRGEEKATVRFALLMAFLSLLLALGHHTPVYKLVYLLPGFDRFRAPSKIMVLWVFSMALLAGIGMNGLQAHVTKRRDLSLYALFTLIVLLLALMVASRGDPSILLKIFSPFVLPDAIPGRMSEGAEIIFTEIRRLTLFGSILLLLLLLLRRRMIPFRVGAAGLCALLLVDLGSVHRKAVRHDDSLYAVIENIRARLDSVLGKDQTPFRVGSFKYSLGANLEMALGYQTVGGFTALFPSRYYEYMTRHSENRLPEGWVSLFYGVTKNHVFMDLLNVKYEILHEQHLIGVRESCLPRAFVVPGSIALRKDHILDFMAGPDFDPKKTLLFETEDAGSLPSWTPSHETPGRVEITSYRPDCIRLVAESGHPAYLFLSEIYYPGWQAFIDGQPARILRGNYLFRVLELPEGRHDILLEFNPSTIRLGSAVTIFTVLFLGVFSLCMAVRRPKPPPTKQDEAQKRSR